MYKPGSWFLLAKCLKNTCERVTLPQVLFKHFASKNQLPGFYISGTLVENGLITTNPEAIKKADV